MKEPNAFFESFEAISPEAFMAQRLAELKDVAEYRKRRIGKYIEWSKPENIAARKLELEKEAPRALENGYKLSKHLKERHELITAEVEAGILKLPRLEDRIKITPISKPVPVNTTWFEKVKRLFR